MGAPQGIIVFSDGIRATDQGATFPFQPFKPSPAGERERFFGRVADLNDMSGDALKCVSFDNRLDLMNRAEKIAHHQNAAVPAQLFQTGHACCVFDLCRQFLGKPVQDRPTARRAMTCFEPRNSFSATDQQ